MQTHRIRAAVVGAALVLLPASARPQPAPLLEPPASVGQPPRWFPYAAPLATWARGDSRTAATLTAGIQRPLMHPVLGLAALAGEAYGTASGPFAGGGARLIARSPALAIGAGIDWNAGSRREGRVDAILTWQSAIRRGGLLGRGTMLRVDWTPTRGRALSAGVHVPLMQPLAGRTRPRRTAAPLPGGGGLPAHGRLPEAAEAAMQRVAGAASLLRVTSTLVSDADVALVRSAQRRGPASRPVHAEAVETYGRELARAFGIVSGDPTLGEAIAARARRGLLDHVLVPYDSLLGRPKAPAGITGLGSRAHASFVSWLRDSAAVRPGAHDAVLQAHARWLRIVEAEHDRLLDRVGDSRMVWLPLQFALAPEQHDDHAEVDSLLGRLVGHPFTDDNALGYLRSADLQLEIARSIYAARRYHVLVTHDFTGVREETGAVDNVAYEMVADAYLPALTAAVRRYDETGALPLYMILIDQWFYEPRNGRLWMSILERPLAARIDLPGDNTSREAHLRARQAELRSAVAASRRLQRDAAAHGGATWLHDLVKVHVSVTYPSDFSFRSHRIIPGIPFTPDNVMRDHRKIVFYDLDEADPYRGALFLMGVGIGEHYASTTWEDRGYRVRGPATLEARRALRQVMQDHRLEIPPPLREVASTEQVRESADRRAFIGRALQVHNDVGFGPKHSSVARAALYDLATSGTIVVVPDPLWLSDEWAGMLAAAALRGARVHVIAPSDGNAPNTQPPVKALAHEVMSRLLATSRTLAEPLRAAGGELRIGLYAATTHVDDAAGRRRELEAGLRRAPWIRELFPFDAKTLAVLERAEARTTTDADNAATMARDAKPRPPQLHQKTQLVARPEAIASLLRLPGWDEVLARQMETQSRQTARFADQLGYVAPSLESEGTREADAMLRAYERSLSEAQRRRVSFYFSASTQNMDPRGLALDGEASLVTSGFQGIAGLVDLYHVIARSTWVSTPDELARLLPRQSGLMHRIARMARAAF